MYYENPIQLIINAFTEMFTNEYKVIGKHNTIICERLGVANSWHPLYKRGNRRKKKKKKIKGKQ